MKPEEQDNAAGRSGSGVERAVRPAAVVCDQHVSGGAVVRWAGSGMPLPPETELYTRSALEAAVAEERQRAADQCASLAWLMENGAGDPQPGGRLRQAQRQILEGKPSAAYLTAEMRKLPPWA